MTNSSTHRATAVLALVIAASTGFAHAQRRPAAAPNFDAFYELGPDSLIRRGVPKEAAVDFMLGHLNIEIAILFEQFPGGVFSDGAKKAIQKAKAKLFQPDWKRVFEPEAVMESVRMITRPEPT